ncbi:MAG TPA: C40 family peptidase [Vicinamibacterales bacterium]|nr:C40 family peptidase [Vicinamibacterales bacterium]
MSRRLLLLASLSLCAAGCASTTTSLAPRPYPGSSPAPAASGPAPATPAPAGIPAPAAPPAAPPDGRTIAEAALRQEGRPYRLGGDTPAGFDCSGLVQYVFAEYGLELPREARDQFRMGRPVARRAIRAGDLLFFHTIARGPSHVGIAIGGGRFVHAPNARGRVRVSLLSAPYWNRRFLGARRIDLTPAPPVGDAGAPPSSDNRTR